MSKIDIQKGTCSHGWGGHISYIIAYYGYLFYIFFAFLSLIYKKIYFYYYDDIMLFYSLSISSIYFGIHDDTANKEIILINYLIMLKQ